MRVFDRVPEKRPPERPKILRHPLLSIFFGRNPAEKALTLRPDSRLRPYITMNAPLDLLITILTRGFAGLDNKPNVRNGIMFFTVEYAYSLSNLTGDRVTPVVRHVATIGNTPHGELENCDCQEIYGSTGIMHEFGIYYNLARFNNISLVEDKCGRMIPHIPASVLLAMGWLDKNCQPCRRGRININGTMVYLDVDEYQQYGAFLV